MKTLHFPYIALGLSSVFLLLVLQGSQPNSDGITVLPLLTSLVLSEFCVFITAIAVYIGIKNIAQFGLRSLYALSTLLCALLFIRFLILGIALWPL